MRETGAPPADELELAQDWQDSAVVSAALNVDSDDEVFTVCGAGDTALALVLKGARSVTCVDARLPQLALAELKLRAAEGMPVSGLRSVLGFDIGGNRVSLYHRVRGRLSAGSQGYWRAHEATIRAGIMQQGRLEAQLSAFRRRVLPLVHRRSTLDGLLALEEPAAQRVYFDRHWNRRRWRGGLRLFFGTEGRRGGREKAAQGLGAEALLEDFERVVCVLPVRSNPYVHWFLTGRYPDLESTHPYLSSEGRQRLAERGDRLRFLLDTVEGALRSSEPGRYSAFHFGRLFDALDSESHGRILRLAVRAARPGALICSWSGAGDRWRPDALADCIDRLETRTAQLRLEDRAVVGGRVHVEQVRPGEAGA